MLCDVQKINPAFNRQAVGDFSRARGKAHESGQDGVLTFERQENPLEAAMLRIEALLRTGLTEDMVQAYEMMRHVWQSLPFGHETETPLLQSLDDTAALIAKRKMPVAPLLLMPMPTKIFS